MDSRTDPNRDSVVASSAIAERDADAREHADFLHLLDATAAEREAWLAEAAARCESYARRLRTLLAEVEGDLGRIEEERRDPDLGRRIGRWQLTRSLGRGATARVSLGVDEEVAEGHPDRRAAIKLFDRVDFGSGFRKRLEREIEALRRIDHPGVVRFLGKGTDEATGRPWVAMEFVDGAMPIVEWASVRAATVDERAELVRQLREALSAAHAAGVVHRDLSPGNVLVDRDGRVKIVDFGIAAVVRESIGRAGSVSVSGLLLGGTPATMAPEQVEPSLGPIGPWTDEYAAAVIAFRLFAGRFPYDTSGSLASVAQAVVHVPAPEIRTLEPATPVGLAAWVDAALVKRPDSRRKSIARVVCGAAPRRRRAAWNTHVALGAAILAAAFVARWMGGRGEMPAAKGMNAGDPALNTEKTMNGMLSSTTVGLVIAGGAMAQGGAVIAPEFSMAIPGTQIVGADISGDLAVFGDLAYPGGGGARIFVRGANGWTTGPILTPPGGRVAFGRGVQVSQDWVVVGDPNLNGLRGVVHVWRRTGNSLAFSQTLSASDGVAGDALGWTACLHGSDLFVNARLDDSWRGSVYRFSLNGSGIWEQRQKIQSPNTNANDEFGWELSAQGDLMLASAWLSECGYSSPSGSIHLFRRGVDGNWTEIFWADNGVSTCNAFAFSTAVWGGSVCVSSGNSQPPRVVVYSQAGTGWIPSTQLENMGLVFEANPNRAVFADSAGVARVVFGVPGDSTPSIPLSMPAWTAGLDIYGGLDGRRFVAPTPGGVVIWDFGPDCDGDGVPDAVAIAQGEPDGNSNGVPDTCECVADVDQSGAVNAVDLAAVLGVWGSGGGKYPRADIDRNGVVNATDLSALLASWGPCP